MTSRRTDGTTIRHPINYILFTNQLTNLNPSATYIVVTKPKQASNLVLRIIITTTENIKTINKVHGIEAMTARARTMIYIVRLSRHPKLNYLPLISR